MMRKPTTIEEWVAMPHPEDIERMKEIRDWQDAEDEAAEELSYRPQWQGLTDEEREEVSKDYGPLSGGEWNLMLLVEQALKEKNSGQ
jgi:hypothetical protein